MWSIAVLLLISFALFLLARIAKTQRMFSVLYFCGVAVWFAAFLACKDVSAWAGLMGFIAVCLPLSELIAIHFLRRQAAPPSVLVKSIDRVGVYDIIMLCLWIAFVAFLLSTDTEVFRSFWIIVFLGLVTASIIVTLVVDLNEITEICVDGIRRNGRLRPWKKHESFSWQPKATDSVELTLVLDSSICPTTRCMVRPEDREAVQQLLEANLPDRSALPGNA